MDSSNLLSPTGVHKRKIQCYQERRRTIVQARHQYLQQIGRNNKFSNHIRYQGEDGLFHDIYAPIKADKLIQLVQSSQKEDKKKEGRSSY
jgi:hypothetical protein